MKTKPEKSFDDLEKEWEELMEQVTKSKMPGLEKFDLANPVLLQRMARYEPGIVAEIRRIVPELIDHPYFRLPTVDLETFDVAHPQAGPGKYLRLTHATYVDAGVSAHFNNGIAAFHPDMMGTLINSYSGDQEFPGVSLIYQFPDDPHAISYEIKFRLFLYNLTGDQGANFLVSKTEWGRDLGGRFQHINLPGLYEEDTTRYLSIRAYAQGSAGVNGRQITFSLRHDDWQVSHTNWWFYSVKVQKTYLG